MHRLLGLALIASIPQVATAQITTFIPPRNQSADSSKAAVAAVQKAQSDSTARAQITNLKTWVDSAAGTPAVPQTAADTLAPSASAVSAVADSTTFPNGARAPATASDLPLMLVVGATLLAIGLVVARTDGRAPDDRRRGT